MHSLPNSSVPPPRLHEKPRSAAGPVHWHSMAPIVRPERLFDRPIKDTDALTTQIAPLRLHSGCEHTRSLPGFPANATGTRQPRPRVEAKDACVNHLPDHAPQPGKRRFPFGDHAPNRNLRPCDRTECQKAIEVESTMWQVLASMTTRCAIGTCREFLIALADGTNATAMAALAI